MNISAPFIRRPVATILLCRRADRGGLLRLRVPAGRGAARGRFSRRHGLGAAARRLARHHGELGGDAADQAVLAPSRRSSTMTRDQRPGLDLDRHPVRAQPRHRPGGGRRAGGDRPHAAAAAGRDDDAAELPQGQSGRCADPAPGAAERHDVAAAARRLRRAGDLAGPVDARRRRRGAGLRQPEICRPRPARSRPRSPRAASASTR